MQNAEFRENLKAFRRARGLSQRELANMAGVTAMEVSRYERGVILPGLEHFMALADALGIAADLLLGRKP